MNTETTYPIYYERHTCSPYQALRLADDFSNFEQICLMLIRDPSIVSISRVMSNVQGALSVGFLMRGDSPWAGTPVTWYPGQWIVSGYMAKEAGFLPYHIYRSLSDYDFHKLFTQNEEDAKYCCADWAPQCDKLDASIVLNFARTTAQFDGKPFVYCPWCGMKRPEVCTTPNESLSYAKLSREELLFEMVTRMYHQVAAKAGDSDSIGLSTAARFSNTPP